MGFPSAKLKPGLLANAAPSHTRVTKDWAAAVKEPPESPHAGLYPHYFSAYNIKWEKLREWLERRFPDEKFKKELANNVKLVSDCFSLIQTA
jgi:hypothetical protein